MRGRSMGPSRSDNRAIKRRPLDPLHVGRRLLSRPPLEVADLIRVAGQKFTEASRRWINGQHRKVLAAIVRCRTAALGGHRDRCVRCGYPWATGLPAVMIYETFFTISENSLSVNALIVVVLALPFEAMERAVAAATSSLGPSVTATMGSTSTRPSEQFA